jgi:hypothetical protein
MSTQLKEKQQAKSKDQVPTRELQADFHFNQHIFRTVAYTAAGFGFGLASSLLFKHKAGMTIFFAGAGAGYGSADFVNELHRFRNQRSPTQINKREGGASSQIREKLDRTTDNLKGDLQQAKNKVERGVEDVSSKVAGQINQTAKGAEEWARNASEKATQHFQSKEHRRGGDDDKDKDDSKSGKKDQQQTQKKQDDSSLKKDIKDQVKQFTKGSSDTQKKDDAHKKEDTQKKDQKEQKKDDTQKKDSKDLSTKGKTSNEIGGEKTSFNTTLKGGMTAQEGLKEAGSKEHKLIGNIRADQYTSKIPDENAFQGYSTPKPEQEGPVKVKREDKSQGGQGKSSADVNKTVNKGGQHFQDFKSNPHELGKGGELHDIKQDYQRNRNKAGDPEADAKRRATHQLSQDLHGESVHQGNNIRVNIESETKQGFQNYKTGAAPSLAKNQVNATLE